MRMVVIRCWIVGLLVAMSPANGAGAGDTDRPAKVTTIRVPGQGIQPQVAVAADGTVHLIYLTGDPHAGDIFYVKSVDGGETFTPPLRANSRPGSAVAMGTVRGPHLALGRNGRVHIAWIGSKTAQPRARSNHTPLLYTRLSDDAKSFEPQRNLIRQRPGVDAGCSVAADGNGNVYVVWHAPGDEGEAEQHRKVWVARSSDDGKTFSVETPASTRPTGACVCCAMRGLTDRKGNLYVLYRSANKVVNRDTYLLASDDGGATFHEQKVHPWTVGQCVMSAAAFTDGPAGVLAAWETKRQVYYAAIDSTTFQVTSPIGAPGRGPNRKHPAVAANGLGDVILAWTEGTGWGKGGAVAWQVFDQQGNPRPDAAGRADGLPAWSVVAAYARPDGTFVIVY